MTIPRTQPRPRRDFRQNAEGVEAAVARLERRYAAALREAEAESKREAARAKWSHKWEGTPETHEAIDRTPGRRRQSALERMHALGKISIDELAAAEEIAQVVERIARAVSVRTGSLEARIDCAGSARDALVESIGRVRMELTYRAWRRAIPGPKAMIIDMILTTVPYVRLAQSYGLHWRTARKRLLSALRMWNELRLVTCREVEPEDVAALYARLGEGVLLPSRPRGEG